MAFGAKQSTSLCGQFCTNSQVGVKVKPNLSRKITHYRVNHKVPNLGINSTFLKELLYVPLPTLVSLPSKKKPWREVILPYFASNKP